jgi:hypothetical protein
MSAKRFIRFSTAPVLAGFSGGTGVLTDVDGDSYAMPIEAGDEIRFIFSIAEAILYTPTALKLAILDSTGTVVFDDVAVVTSDKYWTVSLPDGLEPGCYRFLIYDLTVETETTEWVTVSTECEVVDGDNTGYQLITQHREVTETAVKVALLISNVFQYALWRTSLVIEFRGRQNGWGFDYETDTNFYQRFRLEFVLNRTKYPEIKKVYRQSNGVYRHANVNIDKKVMLDTDYFDERTHDAFAVAIKHDEFYIGGIAYFSSEEYEPDWVEASTDNRYFELAKASTELFIQGYDQRNNVCAGIDEVGVLPPECIEVTPGDPILV